MIKLDGKKDLHQWESNRYILVPECDEVYFSRAEYGFNLKTQYEDGKARIPDEMLWAWGKLYVWCRTFIGDGNLVEEKAVLDVNKAPKPVDYMLDLRLLKNQIGNLANLETQDKTSLVNAINEILKNNGGNINVETIEKIVDEIVPDWAKQSQKPTYTAEEVGALPDDTEIPSTEGLATKKYVDDAIADIDFPTTETSRIETAESVITLKPNKFYVFPELPSLSITLGEEVNSAIVQEYKFRFISGETATTLTLPETVKGDITVNANSVIEISIIDNYAVSQSWAVS